MAHVKHIDTIVPTNKHGRRNPADIVQHAFKSKTKIIMIKHYRPTKVSSQICYKGPFTKLLKSTYVIIIIKITIIIIMEILQPLLTIMMTIIVIKTTTRTKMTIII